MRTRTPASCHREHPFDYAQGKLQGRRDPQATSWGLPRREVYPELDEGLLAMTIEGRGLLRHFVPRNGACGDPREPAIPKLPGV